eukprot:scaffold2940_cov63-Phaeocystis_antarctica.AAC.4
MKTPTMVLRVRSSCGSSYEVRTVAALRAENLGRVDDRKVGAARLREKGDAQSGQHHAADCGIRGTNHLPPRIPLPRHLRPVLALRLHVQRGPCLRLGLL